MKILMISPNLANNNVVRIGMPFYSALKAGNQIIVAGILKNGAGICPQYKELLNFFPLHADKRFFGDLFQLIKICKSSDIIHTFKVGLTSLVLGVFLKFICNKPLVADIDDFDYHPILYKLDPFHKALILNISNSFYKFADEITVTTSQVQKVYGGTRIYSGTDPEKIDPQRFNPIGLKNKLGLKNMFVITFMGSPRRYKGIDIILKSIDILRKKHGIKNIRFLLVGSTDDPDFKKLNSEFKEYIVIHPLVSYEIMPNYLKISDLVITLQLADRPWSIAQVPAKVFDAMAMGVPMIVSNTGDIPSVVENSALVIEPNDPHACAEAILKIYNNPVFARKLGKLARKICLNKFSREKTKKKIIKVYKSVINP